MRVSVVICVASWTNWRKLQHFRLATRKFSDRRIFLSTHLRPDHCRFLATSLQPFSGATAHKKRRIFISGYFRNNLELFVSSSLSSEAFLFLPLWTPDHFWLVVVLCPRCRATNGCVPADRCSLDEPREGGTASLRRHIGRQALVCRYGRRYWNPPVNTADSRILSVGWLHSFHSSLRPFWIVTVPIWAIVSWREFYSSQSKGIAVTFCDYAYCPQITFNSFLRMNVRCVS
jgi:hypothetical protein